MPSSIGALFALGALASLSAGALPQDTPAGDSITVAICGEHGTMSIPLGRSPLDPRQGCQSGCHAICHRKDLLDRDEE
ncbi:MAG: hypothetical protein V4475_18170 [Pseudomonadota bacterium]